MSRTTGVVVHEFDLILQQWQSVRESKLQLSQNMGNYAKTVLVNEKFYLFHLISLSMKCSVFDMVLREWSGTYNQRHEGKHFLFFESLDCILSLSDAGIVVKINQDNFEEENCITRGEPPRLITAVSSDQDHIYVIRPSGKLYVLAVFDAFNWSVVHTNIPKLVRSKQELPKQLHLFNGHMISFVPTIQRVPDKLFISRHRPSEWRAIELETSRFGFRKAYHAKVVVTNRAALLFVLSWHNFVETYNFSLNDSTLWTQE